MTNAAANTASDNNTAGRKAWPQRFGTMTDLRIKKGANGDYAIMTIDCKKFTQTAFVFKAETVQAVKNAGIGASVWVKGPLEEVERTNAEGRAYKEDMFKVVYFVNKSDAAAADEQPTADDAAHVADEAPVADDQVADAQSTLDEEIPF